MTTIHLNAPEMWQDLSVWMQRREMIDYCLLNYQVDPEDAKDLIKLIDVAIRNRIRNLLKAVELENLPTRLELATVIVPSCGTTIHNPPRRRCPKCFHVNRVMWCRCECHLQPGGMRQ